MIGGKRLTVLFLLLLAIPVFGQRKSKEQLQKERQQQLEKIKQVEKILSETTSKKKNTLGELNALNQRIEVQESLIRSINDEIALLNQEIAENNSFVTALEEDLVRLKKEYAQMLFAAQKANSNINRLIFLFSSKSFDQFIMRLQYMKQYANQRKLQAEAITRVQGELLEQIKITEAVREEKNKLLQEELAESQRLAELRKKQQSVVRNLEKEEKTLRRDLEETRKAIAQLDKLITEIVREEMERAARESRNRSAATAALSGSFEENRKKLSWPVNGFVSMNFGRQKHPALKGVEVVNEGIIIQTAKGEKVRSVFNGEVRQVAFIPPFGNSVIISHGEYYSIYAGLREVFVKRGQQVTANQEIGEVLSTGEGISELRFQIRKNTTALDPMQWLRN
ncbi:MAG: peptidoglycan DD-metalloendopeptidase family protein [Cyclobacteriaceae bacterium]|nr:peptidoglycan DD-metalloendopeptidase family protein [Cyclobacteriaceae bacterium]